MKNCVNTTPKIIFEFPISKNAILGNICYCLCEQDLRKSTQKSKCKTCCCLNIFINRKDSIIVCCSVQNEQNA